MPHDSFRRARRAARGAVTGALAWSALALALLPAPATAGRDIDELHAISDLEDRRSLADGRLVELLHDDDAETRAAAARALGRIADPSAVEPLLEALQDGDEDVRLEAIFALGQIGAADARDPLRRIAGSRAPVDERDEAVLALGKLEGDGAAEALQPFLADPVARLRADAAIALARTADSVAALDLRPLLADPDPTVRASAAWATGRLKAKALADDLRPLLGDADGAVRMAAAKSAGQIEDVEAIDALSLLAVDPDWRIRVNAATALGRTKSLEALPGIAVLAEDGNSNVRTAAAAALVDIPYHYKKDDVMFGLRRDGVPQVVAALMQPMAQGQEQRDTSLLEHWEACGDSSLPVVLEAYRSFADASRRMPDWSPLKQWRGAVSFYMRGRMLNPDAPLGERVEGAYQLGAFDTSWHRPNMLEVLDPKYHWAMRAAIIHTLGELSPNDTTAFEEHKEQTPAELVGVLDADPMEPGRPDVRLAVAEALSHFDHPLAKETLARLATDDPDWRVRDEAVRSLERLGAPVPEGVPPRYPLPGDPEPLDDAFLRSRSGRYTATVTTDHGSFVIELLNRDAPRTVQSFVQLAEAGFYDGLPFHRVVPNFVIQGGDPIGNGWGDPGYTLRCEYNRERFERGTVGMAHAGKDTGGSQFFVTHSPQPHLDGRYTVFGRVIQGMEIVDEVRAGDPIRSVEIKKALF